MKGEVRQGIWRMIGKKGHFEHIECEGVEMREETVEEEGAGKLVEMANEAKKQVLRSSAVESRENREEKAVEISRRDRTSFKVVGR